MSKALVGLLFLLFAALPASAHADDPEGLAIPAAVSTPLTIVPVTRPTPANAGLSRERGPLLPALYVGLAGLNALDGISTMRGVANGAAEGNPMMRRAARNPAVMWSIKGGITAATIGVAESLWRQDRKAAAITTIVVSSAIAGFAATHNVQRSR
jgi:hypothetical protein